MSDRRIVVAVDFGTTYSGVAWSESTRPTIQRTINTWPGVDGITESSPKVPTELRSVRRGYQWGFEIPRFAKRHQYFKLQLDDPQAKTRSPSPAQLTEAYFKELWNHVKENLELTLSEGVVASTPMEFVVTVPAIWSDYAKRKTREAAENAGFRGRSPLYIVTEPEAAAMYCVKNLNSSRLVKGSKFLVCDAGGGTVDLISYQIAHLNELQLEEVTEGTGGKCGSSKLNDRFRDYLKKTHGERYWNDERLAEALSVFEQYKKSWEPNAVSLILRVDKELKCRRDRYVVPEDHMIEVMEPVMRDVVALVKEQLRLAGDGISCVLLVGGFGQNKHLKALIQESISSSVSVLQPEYGWTAVVRGAAMLGINRLSYSDGRAAYANAPRSGVKVASRIARKSLGVLLCPAFDSTKHDASEKRWSEISQRWSANVLYWFIEKGKPYPESDRPEIKFCEHLNKAELDSGKVSNVTVYENAVDLQAPIHLNKHTHKIATLDVNLKKVPDLFEESEEKWNGKEHYYEITDFFVEARLDSAMVTYTIRRKGVTHDVVTVKHLDD